MFLQWRFGLNLWKDCPSVSGFFLNDKGDLFIKSKFGLLGSLYGKVWVNLVGSDLFFEML